MSSSGASQTWFKESTDWPFVYPFMHYIFTRRRHHPFVTWLSVSNLLRVCMFSSCVLYFSLRFQMDTWAQCCTDASEYCRDEPAAVRLPVWRIHFVAQDYLPCQSKISESWMKGTTLRPLSCFARNWSTALLNSTVWSVSRLIDSVSETWLSRRCGSVEQLTR